MESKIWKVRAVKAYQDAHTHILVGEVRSRDEACVELDCRSFHFGRSVNAIRDIRAGAVATRIIPWSRIEIINVLAPTFDFRHAALVMDDNGDVLLSDQRHQFPITTGTQATY